MVTAAHMLIAGAAIVRAIQPNNFTIMLLVLVLVHFCLASSEQYGALQHPICSTQKTQVMCTEVGWGEKMLQLETRTLESSAVSVHQQTRTCYFATVGEHNKDNIFGTLSNQYNWC